MFPYQHYSEIADTESEIVASNINMMVTLGGMSLMLLGVYLFIRGIFLFSATRKKDDYFLKEYGSKSRPPLFFVTLGAALFAAGFIVAFVPFSTSVTN